MIYTIGSFYSKDQPMAGLKDGRWVRAIPLPYYGGYIRGAWAVLTGKAVALRYPEAGELEDAIGR